MAAVARCVPWLNTVTAPIMAPLAHSVGGVSGGGVGLYGIGGI